MQACQQLLYRGTLVELERAFTETIPVTGKVAYRPRSGKPRVTTAAADCYNIVLQHLLNRRLTAAATGRQYGIFIHRLSEIVRTDRTSVLNSHRRHRTVRRNWCRRHLSNSDVLIGI